MEQSGYYLLRFLRLLRETIAFDLNLGDTVPEREPVGDVAFAR